jgi:hypothetical protein
MKKIFFIFLMALISHNIFSQEIYEINWISLDNQHYQGALVFYKNYTGKLRVKYHVGPLVLMAEQSIRTELVEGGIRLSGYNPVYPNTDTQFPGYNADNFYLIKDVLGSLTITNIDDGGSTARASIRLIEEIEKAEFLLGFSWTL